MESKDQKKATSAFTSNDSDIENTEVNLKVIDYKNVALMKKYITSGGRILSRRMTKLSAKVQRKVTKEIKKLRFLGLLPYCDRHKRG